jgi:hypothetical protein
MPLLDQNILDASNEQHRKWYGGKVRLPCIQYRKLLFSSREAKSIKQLYPLVSQPFDLIGAKQKCYMAGERERDPNRECALRPISQVFRGDSSPLASKGRGAPTSGPEPKSSRAA